MRTFRESKAKSNYLGKQVVKYLALPLIGLFVSMCPSVAHAARDCILILPSSGYENYDCNKILPPVSEVKVDAKPDAKRCVTIYHSGAASRFCNPPKRPSP